MKRISFSTGFSLIEVLIALLVLSIGLLGLAGLQVTSLKYGQDAFSRSSATILAYNLIDRIHMRKGKNTNYTGAEYIGTAACGDVATCCDASITTVNNDLACWSAELQKTLPGSSGTIADAGGGRLQIDINWIDREGSTPGTPAYFTQSWVITP